MAEFGYPPSGPPSQRLRYTDEAEQEERRRGRLFKAVAAVIVVLLCVMGSGAAQTHAHDVRRPIHEPKRMQWKDHEEDLDEQEGWRRSYRMEKTTFYKLADLLRPLLEGNAHFAGKLRRDTNVARAVGHGQRLSDGTGHYTHQPRFVQFVLLYD